jgi:hypothetical protein
MPSGRLRFVESEGFQTVCCKLTHLLISRPPAAAAAAAAAAATTTAATTKTPTATMTEIRKISNGDPLFDAARKWEGLNTANKEQEAAGVVHQDPIFQDLMIHSPKSTLPLHNYYSEFRLGQGDPLMKAAMKKWPFTTTGDEDKETEQPKLEPVVRTRSLGRYPDHTLADPSSGHQFWSFNDVVHIDQEGKLVGTKRGDADDAADTKERRFVIV